MPTYDADREAKLIQSIEDTVVGYLANYETADAEYIKHVSMRIIVERLLQSVEATLAKFDSEDEQKRRARLQAMVNNLRINQLTSERNSLLEQRDGLQREVISLGEQLRYARTQISGGTDVGTHSNGEESIQPKSSPSQPHTALPEPIANATLRAYEEEIHASMVESFERGFCTDNPLADSD